jgi:hypothetical protein
MDECFRMDNKIVSMVESKECCLSENIEAEMNEVMRCTIQDDRLNWNDSERIGHFII